MFAVRCAEPANSVPTVLLKAQRFTERSHVQFAPQRTLLHKTSITYSRTVIKQYILGAFAPGSLRYSTGMARGPENVRARAQTPTYTHPVRN